MKRFLSAVLVVSMLASIGCSGSPSSDSTSEATPTPATSTAAKSYSMRVATEHQGTRYQLDLQHVATGGFTGLRTVTKTDGTSETEAVTLAADELGDGSLTAPGGASLLEGIEVESSTSRPGFSAYVLKTPEGASVNVEIEGDVDYPLPAAAAIIAALTPTVFIAVCGGVLYYSIKRCADNKNCWSAKLSWNPASVCTGHCVRC